MNKLSALATATLLLAPAAVTGAASSSAAAFRDVDLVGTSVLIGGTGMPTIPDNLVDRLETEFLVPKYGDGYENLVNLATPQEFSGQSYEQGAQILLNELSTQNGDQDVLVFGVSQGAGILGMAISSMMDSPDNGIDPEHLQFVALAPPTNPGYDGGYGLFEQPDLHWLMQTVFGGPATEVFPVDTPYATDIYYGAYDPISDLPTNLWNPIALANSIAGMATVHGGYENMTQSNVDAAVLVAQMGSTNVFMIPTDTLPLLQLIDGIEPLYDLLEPVTRVLVNEAYGNLNHGIVLDDGTMAPFLEATPYNTFVAMGDALGQGFDSFFADLNIG